MFRVDVNLNATRKRKRTVSKERRKKYQPMKRWKVTPLGQPAVDQCDIISRLNGHSPPIVEQIFSYLDYESVINAEKVSSDWKDVLKNERVWKALIKRKIARDLIWRTIFKQVIRSAAGPQPSASDDVYMTRVICQEVENMKRQFIALTSSSVNLLSSSISLITKVVDMFKLIGFGDSSQESDDECDDY